MAWLSLLLLYIENYVILDPAGLNFPAIGRAGNTLPIYSSASADYNVSSATLPYPKVFKALSWYAGL